MERWVGSVRRECLDRLLIVGRVGRRQLEHVLRVYVLHYNRQRPHRALDLQPPDANARSSIAGAGSATHDLQVMRRGAGSATHDLQVMRRDLLGGLIHEYEHAPAA